MRSLRPQSALLLAAFLVPICAHAAVKWTAPTPDELSMTAEPKAPGAPAIILSYEETDDANSAEVTIHVRIKVLTSGGLSAATIVLPERIVDGDPFNQEVSARTIHTDGTIIPFTGTPQNMTVAGEEDEQRVISLPDVEVGSILEYICHFNSQNSFISQLIGFYTPVWLVQQSYFVRSAHFSLKAPDGLDPKYVRWVAKLPSGVAPQHVKDHVNLDLTDIPAKLDEEFAPPPTSAFYNVRFFFYSDTRDKYWGSSGDRVDSVWSDYYTPHKALVAAVHDLVLPTDTDEQKLHKIYNAVMKFENTDLTRRYSQREDKKNGVREIRNSEDTWLARRGDSEELTLLFIALARAAGYPAHPMAVASRNRAVFDLEVLSWSQLDSMVAIVQVNGHDIFFDPGTRFCPFAHMAPWHSNVIGVSSDGRQIKIRGTPKESYNESGTERIASLSLAADDSVTGTVNIAWGGTAGLSTRQMAIEGDQKEVESKLTKSIQEQVPPGVELKLVSITGLTDGDQPLVATFTVSGTLGTATQKRLLLPAQFFESASKPLLVPSTRTLPINFPEVYSTRDVLALQLPAGFSVEALPDAANLSLKTDAAVYKMIVQSGIPKAIPGSASKPNAPAVMVQRMFVLNKIDFTTDDYPDLHRYFGQIAAADQQQIIIRTKPAAPAGN
jgi:hypothetical protein